MRTLPSKPPPRHFLFGVCRLKFVKLREETRLSTTRQDGQAALRLGKARQIDVCSMHRDGSRRASWRGSWCFASAHTSGHDGAQQRGRPIYALSGGICERTQELKRRALPLKYVQRKTSAQERRPSQHQSMSTYFIFLARLTNEAYSVQRLRKQGSRRTCGKPSGTKSRTETGHRPTTFKYCGEGTSPSFIFFAHLLLLNRSWVKGEPIRTVLAIFRAFGTTRSTA